MYNSLLYTNTDGICTITLNRPDVYNAFNEELSAELIDALKKTAKDDSIRVVVLTGATDLITDGGTVVAAPARAAAARDLH